jgi:hypothetical protein
LKLDVLANAIGERMPSGMLSRPVAIADRGLLVSGVIEANDLCLECGAARGDTLPTIEDQRHSTTCDAESSGINGKDTLYERRRPH